MKKEELNEWGYPIHPKSDYSKPPEGNFVSWVGVILVFTEISWGILKIVGIIWLQRIKKSILKKLENSFEEI